MLREFKAFAMRGNMLDLAVGIVIGVAFGAVVNSLVADLITPLIAATGGETDFSALTVTVGEGILTYGNFLNALASFIVIAFALFGVIKVINRALRPKGASPEPPTTRECPHCLTAIPVAATRCAACTSKVEPMAA